MKQKNWLLIRRYGAGFWDNLRKYLKEKLYEIEDTKALIFTSQNKEKIRDKLEAYNKENYADFFMD